MLSDIYLYRLLRKTSGSTKINTNRTIQKIANGTNLGLGEIDVDDFIDKVFYDSEAYAVTMSGGTTLEKGDPILSRTLTIVATKQSTSLDIASIIVTSNLGYDSGDIKTGVGTQTIAHSITLTSNTNEVFTVTVTGSDSKMSTATTTFTYKVARYWGKIDHNTGITDADILALTGAGVGSGKELAETVAKDFKNMDMAGEYHVYGYDSSAGEGEYFVGGFANGAYTLIRDNTFINVYGYSYTLKVYVSNSVQGAMSDLEIKAK